ncbi:AAA family ATPase [Rubrobacter indicoceani]|uniref:AAA family ATPase n=1 Tax=Rubrobacter indicoceani TaxID=2051957 RepID=UPI0013C49FEF|nr:SMC family ATPase [Rubrobacter indicoceani]
MILSSLKLENFKQFHAPLVLEPPEGAVGVVGPNGSGKTTLFEAILWAFFGAKAGGLRFANDAIPWSGGSTAEKSTAEVTLDLGGASYTVSRSLHRGKATACVYDSNGAEVTGGPNDVSNWVQEKLLEMDRVAFDATFFARQKELEFFAGTTGVNRQREVARILGLDQVEKAQRFLRADRGDLRSEAKAIEQILSGANLDELEAALSEQRRLRTALKERASGAAEKLEARTKNLEEARADHDRHEELYREHNRLISELGGATATRDRASDRAKESEARLRKLDKDRQRIRELEPESRGLPEVEAELAKLEESRRREERLESAKRELARVRREAYTAAREAADLLEALSGSDELLPGWSGVFTPPDDLERARLATEVLVGADEAHECAVVRLEALRKMQQRHEELRLLEERLKGAAEHIGKKKEELSALDAEIEALTGGGSLDDRLASLRGRHGGLKDKSSRLGGLARATGDEAKKLARARAMIESSDEHAKCPTCQRGYKDDEHTEVTASIRRQEEELSRRADATRAECRRLEAEANEVQREIEAAERSRSRFHELKTRRAATNEKYRTFLEKRDEISCSATKVRRGLDGAPPPDPEQLEAAREAGQRLRDLRDARPKLLGLLSASNKSLATASGVEREVASLSEGEPYRAERHEQLGKRREGIRHALWQLQSLGENLKARPEVEARLKEERAASERAAARAAQLGAACERLGFSEEAHAGAKVAVASAERLRDESREEKALVERELHDAEGRISGLEKELSRYADQRGMADDKAKEAASLDGMDRLMSEFYRELTARVRPELQREASGLVSTLTDGRYTRMEFDENYAVRLFDGVADAYEISRFSGGEADVVSLSARVALSKMISGRGAGALGFIVLDEVFGALDANRRTNVLRALERLKRTFGQIFIISHVADVQESPLLDETWFVEEDEEGRSTVRVARHVPLGASELPV